MKLTRSTYKYKACFNKHNNVYYDMEKERLIKVFADLKRIETLPEDVTIALQSFITAAEGMIEFDIHQIPSEYLVNLINTLGKYPKYRAMANHLALIVLKESGYFDKK